MTSENFLRNNYEKLGEERVWERIQKNIEESYSNVTNTINLLTTAQKMIVSISLALIALVGIIYTISQQNPLLGSILAIIILITFIKLNQIKKEIENSISGRENI